MSKIFVSMPCVGGVIHQKTVITCQTLTEKHHLKMCYIENCSLITKGRQDHFGMFYKSDCDYLLSIDADMVVGPPGILDRMIEETPQDSIVGGMYAMKALDKNGNAPVNGGTLIPNEPVILDGRLIKMRHIPTGFMLTPRSVAEKMVKMYDNLKYEDFTIGTTWAVYNTILEKDQNGINRFLPEDFSYCKRARDCGVDIYAHTGCMLGHIGQYLYHIEHLRK